MQRAFDGKEALQRQLAAAKASGSSSGGGDQSVLSLMMQVEDLKSKVGARHATLLFVTFLERLGKCCIVILFDAFLCSSVRRVATR